MFEKKPSILFVCLLGFTLIFFGCAGLEYGGTGGASYAGNTGRSSEPNWVRDPYAKYDRQANVAAVGNGNTREMAEKSAFGNLAAIFGQNIHVDEKVSLSYQAAVKNGVTAGWSESTAVDTAIFTSVSMDSLGGAEIGEAWNDGKTTHYAVAVLNKAKASRLYSDMVNSNQAMIDKLVNIPPEGKDTLNGFARYQFAATVADMTRPYVNLLSVIGGPVPAFKSGDDYRLEALGIINAIPIGITVRNDKSGRIQGAFAKALSDLGLNSGGSNSQYLLDVNIATAPVELPSNPNKFSRIELKADLKDIRLSTVLLPFDFNSREGHTTVAEAENRAYAAAERKINEDYAKLLNNYLYQLLLEK
jgi:hypothetical protein